MGKRLLLILGNGVTIDLLKQIKRSDDIDTSNLFRYGSMVPWPGDKKPGFLSYKYCPNLWNLGARSTTSTEDAGSLIEEIIQCANVYGAAAFSADALDGGRNPNDIYIKAYHELLLYLRHLFVHYDFKIGALQPAVVAEWSWLKILKAAVGGAEFDQVSVITYCYDIWLERALTAAGVPYFLGGFQTAPAGKAVEILKPHGSISFCYNQALDASAFTSIRQKDFLDHSTAPTSDFTVEYADLARIFLLTPLIPPAGQSKRLGQKWVQDNVPGTAVDAAEDTATTSVLNGWAQLIRSSALERAKALTKNDELLISGLSYWHVDRDEIDSLLAATNPLAEVKMINPVVPRSLNAVLTSLFPNYRLFPNANVLSEALP